MNNLVQYNWLKDYLKLGDDPKPVAKDLTLYGAPVEKIQAVKHAWTDVVVAQIIKIEPHPNADKLQLATVQVTTSQTRLIVCGAPNIAVGQKVALALPGTYLNEQMTIIKREVRGVTSDGMICSAKELGLSDDHTGILVLHPDTPVGVKLSSLGSLSDFILEIEPTTNRPDLRSVIGVAREISAIMGYKLDLPKPPALPKKGKSDLKITVVNKKLCPRYLAISLSGLKIEASPWWLQERLSRAGLRSINSVVDVTNYVLLEYGQPLHAFDKQLLGNTIVVRPAKAGESIQALDGNTYNLTENNLVIADSTKPVVIAGVMGGLGTGVTPATTAIVLECATFEPVNIRRTSRALNLISDSSQLFEKGLSTEAPAAALARAVELILEICGGQVDGSVVDVQAGTYHPPRVKFSVALVGRLLGVVIPVAKIKKNLQRLGFKTSGHGQILTVEVPYWRDHDITIAEDLVEEVARLYGYHNFPSELPAPSMDMTKRSSEFADVHRLRDVCRQLGYTETMNYSFIRLGWLTALNYPLDQARKLLNPLNAELQYMRPSLLPSLLQNVESNAGEAERLNFFELAKIYLPGVAGGRGIDGYRREEWRLALVQASAASTEQAYREIKGVVETILDGLGLDGISWQAKAGVWPFADGATASLTLANQVIGQVGILHPLFCSKFGVSKTVVAAELNPTILWSRAGVKGFVTAPKFPAAKRDISLVSPLTLRYSELDKALRAASPLLEDVELFDIYRGDKLAVDQQGLALHLTFRQTDKTLKAEEVEIALAEVLAALKPLGVNLRQ